MSNILKVFSSYKLIDVLMVSASLVLMVISYLLLLQAKANNLSLIVQVFPALATAAILGSFYSKTYTVALTVRLVFCAAQIYSLIVIFQRISR